MTPEERTHQALLKVFTAKDEGREPGSALVEIMYEAIRQAEADMKERCAKVAEDDSRTPTSLAGFQGIGLEIAEAIRALE
jgi:hypothetical protein